MTAEKLPSVPRATCGSYAGYKAHRAHNEIVCDDCKAARNQWEKDRRASRAEARDRAALTDEEKAYLDNLPWTSCAAVHTYVEQIIADRLLRYA